MTVAAKGDVTGHVVFSSILVGVLVAGLAFFLVVLTIQLTKIARKLEGASELVAQINADAATIPSNLEHTERTANTIAEALPLVYGFAERVLVGVSPTPERPAVAKPASGTRRSRLHESVGYHPN
ncbi:MAG: hypothetical protein ACT4QG_04935 [Sporichthyaceae bacterium]